MRYVVFLISFFAILFFSSSAKESYHGLISNCISILFVFGGTLLATLISYPLEKLKNIKDVLLRSYYMDKFNYSDSTKKVMQLARSYKRIGLKALEDSVESIHNPYLQRGIQLIADNAEWDYIKESIEKEFIFDGLQSENVQRMLHAMAKYAPAFGLAGTIIGLMMIFPQQANPQNIGNAMSLALLTTLYGVLATNLLLLPLEHKLKDSAVDDELMFRYIIESLQCIQRREHSIVIEQRLTSVMPKHELLKYRSSKDEFVELRIAEN